MNIDIRDLLDGYREEEFEPRGRGELSLESVRRLTMRKIKQEKTTNRRKRWLAPLAACAAVLLLTVGALAYAEWHGFALSGGMSAGEIAAVLEEASHGTVGEMVESDGTVHYYDGLNETLVLSEEEAAAYEQAREEARVQAVRESTSLLDMDTMEFVPSGVTELAISPDGSFADFLVGNGHMVILYPEGSRGLALRAGDRVTVSVTADETCYLEFGMVKDGAMLETVTDRARAHEHTFTAPEDGIYCFTLLYSSASASAFTDGRVTVETQE